MKRVLVTLAVLCVVTALSSEVALAGAGKKTHLGVKSAQIVNVETFLVPNDNSGGHNFYYDRQDSPVEVPQGFSFVVTDIQVFGEPAVAGNHLVYINTGTGLRSFVASFTEGAFYKSLTSGIVIPGGTIPTVRNTTFSIGDVSVQMQGYYVKGGGLPEGESPF